MAENEIGLTHIQHFCLKLLKNSCNIKNSNLKFTKCFENIISS